MDSLGEKWLKIFNRFGEKTKIKVRDILYTINSERDRLKGELEIYPDNLNIFRCFQEVDYDDIKVVIIGQDPYHGKDQATGLAFGVTTGNKLPPSLKNIQKEILQDLNIELLDTTLEKWAKQGVLLLNTSLSVIESTPGSHIKYWQDFTQFIIDEINNLENVIFVAWGAHAYSRLKNIDRARHSIIVSSHPSPLSCNKKFGEYPPFLGSKPFSRINTILCENNKSEIKW